MVTENFFKIALYGHDVTLAILIFMSVFSLAFILERWLALKSIRVTSEKMKTRIQESLQSNSLKDLEEIGRDRETLESRALSYGLRHLKEHGSAGLEEIFTTYSLLERPKLEKYLNFLATVGSNAPFIGLLGTVFGIMDAFRGLAESQGDATAVMIGISKALIATAVGLFVAIPAVMAFNYFQKQVRGILQGLDTVKEICIAYGKTLKKGA